MPIAAPTLMVETNFGRKIAVYRGIVRPAAIAARAYSKGISHGWIRPTRSPWANFLRLRCCCSGGSTPVALSSVSPLIITNDSPFRLFPIKRETVRLTDAVNVPRKVRRAAEQDCPRGLYKHLYRAELRATNPVYGIRGAI